MKFFGTLESYLIAMIVITLFNAFIGENFSSTILVSIIVAATVTYKGFTVIDHFMELKGANNNLRLLMKLYLALFPSLIVISSFF